MSKTKAFDIPKIQVMKAFRLVKANAGSAGVDRQSIADFESDLKNNLYKIWNRMSSGTYFPPPVKAVSIPKKSGGSRTLGIPTVADRVAQMVVKLTLEPEVEPHFLPDSYGYRPNKSALDAIEMTRKRCWRNDWVLEFDIKGLFDNIRHDLLMKAVKHHTKTKWIVLYVERWLVAPMQLQDGALQERHQGTPQGGVISPLLANLFLHYTFDVWMKSNYPANPWCRYADDGLVHAHSRAKAVAIRQKLAKRFEECGLELHPLKTKIVYCGVKSVKNKDISTSFDFLGYTFRPRLVKSKAGGLFVSFNPAVSSVALNSMRAEIRKNSMRRRSDLNLHEIAKFFNPRLRGWYNYYGKFNRSGMLAISRHFNKSLIKWSMRKYKSLKGHKRRAMKWLLSVKEQNPSLFYHWQIGMTGSFI